MSVADDEKGGQSDLRAGERRFHAWIGHREHVLHNVRTADVKSGDILTKLQVQKNSALDRFDFVVAHRRGRRYSYRVD